MRRLALLLLAAALCVSLPACAGGGSAPAAPTPAPSPEPTPFSPAHPTSAAVFTDWSALTAYAPPEEICTRLTPEPMETLRPGSYGTLLPFSSENRYAEWESGWQIGSLYGLVTEKGMIVLDPVCSGAHRLVYYEDAAGAGAMPCPFLVLEKLLYLPDAPDAHEWNRGWVERYAVCAEDGSWCTDFVYENVLGSALGALCVRSAQENLAECLSGQGKVVFSTENWDVRGEMTSWCVSMLSRLRADNWAPVQTDAGRDVFVNARGETLPIKQDLWIETAEPFSEGLAAVRVDGEWGFLDESGALVIEPQYAGVGYGGFLGGYAIVYTDGRGRRSALIDRAGSVVLEDETIGRELHGGVGWYHCFSDSGSDRWYDAAFNPVTLGGKTPDGAWTELGFYAEDKGGIRVLTFDGRQRFYAGAESISVYEDYVFAYAKDECRVYDAENQLVGKFPRGSWPGLLRDDVTGERYLFVSAERGCDVYTERGEFLLHTRDWSAPRAGLFYCSDNLTTGYKNAAGEWVFRIRVDQGD